MKLSDIMGHAGLAFYAEVALVLFLLAFVIQAARAYAPGARAAMARAGELPLDDPNDQLVPGAAPRGAAAGRREA